MKNEELFRLEFFILHFYTLSGVQLCILMVMPDYTADMTSKLYSLCHIAAPFVRLIILQRED